MASVDLTHNDGGTGGLSSGHQFSRTDSVSGVRQQDLDILIIGAGFAGVYQLKHLRDLGHKVLLVDNGSDYGGTWFWNRYPGIRVDTGHPQYLFSDPELRKDFAYTQRFPGGAEIRAYLSHAAKLWDLRKDTEFETYIETATWDNQTARWSATAKGSARYTAKFLVFCTGALHSKFVPKWKDAEDYKGLLFHPASWPHEELDFKGKKVAVVGTGATAVQIIQEVAKEAGQLIVYQRTPNTALPMGQVDYGAAHPHMTEEQIKASMETRLKSFAGMEYTFLQRKCFDDTSEQRRQLFEEFWKGGDFKYWLGTYSDTLFNKAANTEAYNFWRDKTRARINDPRVANLLAPMEPFYAFGTKRIPLEQNFFELFNLPHVKLVDLRSTPISHFTSTGIATTAEELEFDIVIAATGYDALTGSLTRIDLRGTDGSLLRDRWAPGVKTHLGMSTHGFPNLFFTYGPQAPTVLCNGPTCAELQGRWIIDAITYCRDHDIDTMEATREAEEVWGKEITDFANLSLLPQTESWYMGDNIPGKKRESLVYLGGVPRYYGKLEEVRERGYEGFELTEKEGKGEAKL